MRTWRWQSWRTRERELAEELESHFRLAVADRMARGETQTQAEASARREFGSEPLVREVTRSMWSGAALHHLLQEVRISLRTLRRTPRFSFAAVLCLGLGIGATMTIFSVLHAVLLRPLPYPNASELVAVRAQHAERAWTGATISVGALDLWRGAGTLAELGTWRTTTLDLTGGDGPPERVPSANVSTGLFGMLGVPPRLGRPFQDEEAVSAASRVVLLGHELWQRRYGGDEAIIGNTIEIGGRPHEIVGVMPAGFSFPDGTALWTPLVAPPLPADVLFYDGVLARLAPAVAAAQAQEEFAVITARLRDELGYGSWRFELAPLREHLLGGLGRQVVLFQAASLLVLLLACANVAALLLARVAARRDELAVRAAIGAARSRLAAHLLVEAGLLALIGGALGAAAAFAGVRLLAHAFPGGVPSWIDLSVHPVVLLLTLATALLAALAFGAAPALAAGRTHAEGALHGAARGPGGVPRERGRAALVVVEIAISVVLLAAAGLLVRTYIELEASLGFQTAGVLSVTVPLSPRAYPAVEQRALFHRDVADRLRALPGVTSVSASVGGVPLEPGVDGGLWTFTLEGDVPIAGEETIFATAHLITPGWLAALGVPLVRGRDITDEPGAGGEIEAVVNESFARRYFPAGDALGRRLDVVNRAGASPPPVRIVGIARDFRHAPPPALLEPALYLHQPAGLGAQTFVIATALADPLVLAPAIRAAVRDIDPSVIVDRIQTQTSIVERTFWRQRLQRNVIGVFASLALLLAVFGVYGVLSYAVAQRTAEFGVRAALGASAGQQMRQVIGDAARLAAFGIIIGLAATLALGRIVASLLYGVTPSDPATLGAAAAVLFLVAIAAAALPALRAARLDPLRAIRG